MAKVSFAAGASHPNNLPSYHVSRDGNAGKSPKSKIQSSKVPDNLPQALHDRLKLIRKYDEDSKKEINKPVVISRKALEKHANETMAKKKSMEAKRTAGSKEDAAKKEKEKQKEKDAKKESTYEFVPATENNVGSLMIPPPLAPYDRHFRGAANYVKTGILPPQTDESVKRMQEYDRVIESTKGRRGWKMEEDTAKSLKKMLKQGMKLKKEEPQLKGLGRPSSRGSSVTSSRGRDGASMSTSLSRNSMNRKELEKRKAMMKSRQAGGNGEFPPRPGSRNALGGSFIGTVPESSALEVPESAQTGLWIDQIDPMSLPLPAETKVIRSPMAAKS